jgi:hypothetical protein
MIQILVLLKVSVVLLTLSIITLVFYLGVYDLENIKESEMLMLSGLLFFSIFLFENNPISSLPTP